MKRIFLVEDDQDDQEIFMNAVGELNSSAVVVPSSDGSELFETLSEETPPKPDVIFLDINMPHTNGFQSIRELKKSDQYRDVPVVILTTSNAKEDIERMYDEGADYFITKPASFGTLKRILNTLISTPRVFARRTRDSFVLNSFF